MEMREDLYNTSTVYRQIVDTLILRILKLRDQVSEPLAQPEDLRWMNNIISKYASVEEFIIEIQRLEQKLFKKATQPPDGDYSDYCMRLEMHNRLLYEAMVEESPKIPTCNTCAHRLHARKVATRAWSDGRKEFEYVCRKSELVLERDGVMSCIYHSRLS